MEPVGVVVMVTMSSVAHATPPFRRFQFRRMPINLPKNMQTLITLTLNPRALAPLTLRSLTSSTEWPAACIAIARSAVFRRNGIRRNGIRQNGKTPLTDGRLVAAYLHVVSRYQIRISRQSDANYFRYCRRLIG